MTEQLRGMTDTGAVLLFAAAFLALAAGLGALHGRRRAEAEREALRSAYGRKPSRSYRPEEAARIPRYYEKHRERVGWHIDDITARDLDLWSLYERVNYCRSATGDEVLYHMLRVPLLDAAALARREEEIQAYAQDGALRLALQEVCCSLGGSGRRSVYDYLDALDGARPGSVWPHLAGDAVLLGSLLLMPFFFAQGFFLLLGAAAFQIVTYYREKGRSDAHLSAFSYILRLVRCGASAERLLRGADRKDRRAISRGERIGMLVSAMAQFRRGAGILLSSSRMSGSGNPFDILADYVRMLLHIDLIKYQQMLREAAAHREEIDALITAVGEMEALISIACYRASLGPSAWCLPETVPADQGDNGRKGLRLTVKALRHPLMEEGAVANSMDAARPVLLTGANASGKSTWLKSLGLAAVMAQTLHTVTAASYRAPLWRVYSSMALTDDLSGGESYYVVEIRALARVLEAAGQGDAPPVLGFVDEVLRGTNTVERIAASAQILDYFSGTRALVFAATHDLELAALLASRYDNYHFEGDLAEGDVRFDYRLKPGPSVTRNAIGLLRRFSYDGEITERAEAMAKRFEETGEWHM